MKVEPTFPLYYKDDEMDGICSMRQKEDKYSTFVGKPEGSSSPGTRRYIDVLR
jgi:hypothetical protein